MFKLKIVFLLFVFGILNIGLSQSDDILKSNPAIGRFNDIAANQVIIRLKPGCSSEKFRLVAMKFGLEIKNQLLENNQSITHKDNNSHNRVLNDDKRSRIIKAEEPLLRTYIVTFDGKISPDEFCRTLIRQSDMIEIAEPIVIDKPLAYLPNDPNAYMQGMLEKCKLLDAWSIWKGDTSMVIGISDGGIFQEHEDLIGNIAPNWGEIPNDGADNDNNGYIDDYIGFNLAYKVDNTQPGRTYHTSNHGTGVSSIASANTDNGKGMAGTGFKCRFFPMKTAKMSSDRISYGYQSIVYAAVRGFKVLNCSWGSAKQFSQIDQSIIDYAISRDVAIVAAAGNENTDIVPVYPASYKGVLSVGNVDLNDELAGSSSLGANVDIMAPGEGNYVATNQQAEYMIEGSGGTSFASPVVAGILGLVRSKYPQMKAEEALSFIRLAVDDIRDNNFSFQGILPGRINAYKALTVDPWAQPGIVYQAHEMYQKGEITDRVYSGETVDLKIKCKNVLGSGNNLRFVLSAGYDLFSTINIIDSVVNVASIESNNEFTLDKFSFSANNDYDGTIILRVDIYGENNYHDFFMLSFIPANEVTTFGNNIIKFSAGDRGQIGFAGTDPDWQGIGLTYKDKGNMIYNAGLMLTAESSTNKLVSSSVFGSYPTYNDFASVKKFTVPQQNTGICNDDANYSGKIGVEVEQVINVPPNNINIIAVDVSVTNKSQTVYQSLAAGYFFDWDIFPVTDSNLVGHFPEAIPESFKAIAATAEFASFFHQDKSVFCGCATFSNNKDYEAQAAGMEYSTIQDFNQTEQFASLNSGDKIQWKNMGDVNMVVGMKFPGPISKNESRTFKFFFGCADTKELLAESIRNSMLGLSIEKNENKNPLVVRIFPLPADDKLNLAISNLIGDATIYVSNVIGESVLEAQFVQFNGGEYLISKNIDSLPGGFYIVRIVAGSEVFLRSFIKK